MFKVTFFTDDKKLPHALRALTSLSYNVEVIPVQNAITNQSKVVQKEQYKTVKERIWEHILKNNITNFTTNEAKSWGITDSPYSIYQPLTELVKEGKIDRIDRGRYVIKNDLKLIENKG